MKAGLVRNRIVLAVVGACAAMPAQAQVGLSREGNQFRGSPYSPAEASYYGFRQAVGDFDGDGIDDFAAIELATSNRMRVYLGRAWTIGTNPPSVFAVQTVLTPLFSNAIVAGDFNGDGIDELALGNRDGGSALSVGGHVTIMQRTSNWTVQQTIRQGLGGYLGLDETGDRYGFSLAVGDFNDDGFDDLAIGARGEAPDTPPSPADTGAVHVVYGSSSGLTGAGDRLFVPSHFGLVATSGTAFRLGSALAAGDFNADGADDLAIGAPNVACPGTPGGVGVVGVLSGSPSGLVTTDAQLLRPGEDGMSGSCATSDNFGGALASGRFGSLALYEGLVIGASQSDVAGVVGAGEIHIVRGSAGGLAPATAQPISLADLPGGTPTSNGQFGNYVASGGLRASRVSVVASSSFEAVDGFVEAGAVRILHKSVLSGGDFDPAQSERWTAGARLGVGPPAAGDRFGMAFAIGDFNDDGRSDLVVGIPYRDEDGAVDAGGIQVLYQSEFLFGDGFDGLD